MPYYFPETLTDSNNDFDWQVQELLQLLIAVSF